MADPRSILARWLPRLLAVTLLLCLAAPTAAQVVHQEAAHAHEAEHHHHGDHHDDEDAEEDCPTCDLLRGHLPAGPDSPQVVVADVAPSGLIASDGTPLYLTRSPLVARGRSPPVA